jgi:SAM-dependent methyltransferase
MSEGAHWVSVRPEGVQVPAWIRKAERADGEAPIQLRDVLAELPDGALVLDLGSGPGSFDYRRARNLKVLATDILPLTRNADTPHVEWFRADGARLPLRDDTVDAVISHYVFEHVTDLENTLDEVARILRPDGVVFCSVPRTASFDDRFYRFAGYVAKYLLGKFKKRIEHVQRFSFESLNRGFYLRGFNLEGFAVVPAGYSWLNDPRTLPFQAGFVGTLGWIKRLFGIDLFRDANFVCLFRRGDRAGYRHVTNVCRRCGEHSVLDPPHPPPSSWTCPWCGLDNGLFLSPQQRRRLAEKHKPSPGEAPR